jgi:hypothetical protein
VRPEVSAALEKLRSIPVDIEPRFTTADRLLERSSEPPIAIH